MRPPTSATPPISHMIPRKALPVTFDWSTLTSDNSIQILQLGPSDENFFEACAVAKPSKSASPSPIHKVSTYYTGRLADTDEQTNDNETPIREKSSALTLSAKMFFTPSSETPSPIKMFIGYPEINQREEICNTNYNHPKLNRKMHSDTDIVVIKGDKAASNQAIRVSRSMSMSYADRISRNQEYSLLKPLKPSVNKTKVGSVKRLTIAEAVTLSSGVKAPENTRQVTSDEKHKKTAGSHKLVRYTESLRLPTLMEAKRTKITNLVKSGLKSLIKNKDSSKISEQKKSKQECSVVKKKRHRFLHRATELGGLAEFLGRNDRRKTVASFPDPKMYEDTKGRDSKAYLNIRKPNTEVNNVSLKYTPKPWTGPTSDYQKDDIKAASSNLKFARCQRKLFFSKPLAEVGTEHSEALLALEGVLDKTSTSIAGADEASSVGESVSASTNTSGQRRPRLGLMGFSKPLTTVPIDELEMNLVRDLKRRVEKANRVSRIKTNGSLFKPKLGQLYKQSTASPRRCCISKNNRILINSSLCNNSVSTKESYL